MKLLLDTHAFLFAIGQPESLSPDARKALLDPALARWVSAVSIWEIAIKINIGKLDLPAVPSFYLDHISRLRAIVLAVEPRHSFELFRLPPHHKDPFDRMLVAQAYTDGMTILTRDEQIRRYPVPTLW